MSAPSSTGFDPAALVACLDALLPPGGAALHEPRFAGNEWVYVKDCLDTGWVSTAGAYVTRFEQTIAEITGVPHVIATNTGTAALHAALVGIGVERDQEVIVPALTFAATAAAVAYIGAVPHFVDVERATLGLDPAALKARLAALGENEDGRLINRETGRTIAAVVVMHALGHPSDLDGLAAVCAEFGLPLVEDAAEALGSLYQGRHVGGHGRVGALSFNGNKILTTGGGGAILTEDAGLAELLRHLTTTAKLPHAWAYVHDRVGFNYRLPNLNAALGCAQLEQLDDHLTAKRRLAAAYLRDLGALPGVTIVAEPPETRSNYWLNAAIVDAPADRDPLLRALHAAGYPVRPLWEPMHHLPMYKDCPRDALAVTEELTARTVCLPSGPSLGMSLSA